MQIHVPTLFYLLCGVSLLVAAKMAVEWRQPSGHPALPWWSAGFLCVALSGLMSVLRTYELSLIGIGLSNAMLLLGYGLVWKGAAVFAGIRAPLFVAAAGFLLWMLAWSYPPFAADLVQRIYLNSAVIVVYSLGTGLILYGSSKRVSARHAGIAYFLHAGLYALRLGALAVAQPHFDAKALSGLSIAVIMCEGIFFVLVIGYLLLSATREQAEQKLLAAAETDFLTGTANRRALMTGARRLLAEPGLHVCVLIFDLDHFKAINDRHGHSVGDDVLKLFCRVVDVHLGPRDVFGRLGGEEFAAALALDPSAAETKAREIVAHFAAAGGTVAGRRIDATVSIGLVTATHADLDALLVDADLALYRAKTLGRNRVEVAADAPFSTTLEPMPRRAAG